MKRTYGEFGNWEKRSPKKQIQEAAMFRIERPHALEELWKLSLTGSLVVTGSPGVGKSWTIAQFVRQCRRENRPCLPLAAEDFDVRSIQDITSALGFKREIIPFLQSL